MAGHGFGVSRVGEMFIDPLGKNVYSSTEQRVSRNRSATFFFLFLGGRGPVHKGAGRVRAVALDGEI